MKKIYKTNWLINLKSVMMLAAMLFAGTSMAQLSGSYTINSGAATSGTNFASFLDLEDTLTSDGISGDVVVDVVVGSGPYSEQFYLDEITGSSSNTLTIDGNGEKITTSSGTVIELEGMDNIVIENLVIEYTGTNSGIKMVEVYDDVEGITIDNCEFIATSTNAYGGYPSYLTGSYLWVSNAASYYSIPSDENDDITITNNTFWKGNSTVNGGGLANGVVINNNPSNDNLNCVFSNNDLQDFGQRGLSSYYGGGMTVTDNNIHNDNNTSSTYCYGIYNYMYNYGGSKVTYEDNMIHDLYTNRSYIYGSTYGIYAYCYYGSTDVDIDNNIIDLNGTYYTYGIYNYGFNYSGTMNVRHNTIRMTGNVSYAYARHYGAYLYYVGNGTVQNNIVLDETESWGATNGGSWGFYTYSNGQNFDYNTINNDSMVSASGGTITNKHIGYDGSNRTTIANWISGKGGANSMGLYPSLTDPANADWTPQSIAMANKGVTSAITTDIAGVTRNATAPDLGALEYFVDVEVVSVDMVGTLTECAPYTEDVVVTLMNNGANDLSGVPIQYEINGTGTVMETVTATITAGGTYQYTFAAVPTMNGSATHVIDVSVVGDDDDPSNSSGSYTVATTASPYGGALTQASNYNGYYNNGSAGDPHVTVLGYECDFDITRPAVHSGTAPGTAYTYTLDAMTTGGMSVGVAEGFEIDGEVLKVNPVQALADSTVSMTIIVTDATTGCDTMFTEWMYIPHTPVPSFVATNICLGDVAQLTNTSTLAGADYMLQNWEFDDPDANVMDDNSDILDGFWNYTTYGTADVILTVVNGVWPLFEYSDTQTITITPKPEVDFKVLNACEGSDIQFNNLTTLPVPGTLTYSWDFGDGSTPSTATSPTYVYTTAGQRQVTLTAEANGCDATLTKNAYQFEMPTAGFTSVGACNFEDIAFTNTSSIANGASMGYTWDFNTGAGQSTIENPTYNSPDFGTIPVKLTVVSEFGCTDEISQDITLLESPVADFTWNNGGPACNLTPVMFTNTGTAPNGGANTSYSWSEMGTQFSTNANPSHPLSAIGMHSITFTAADLNGCQSSITKDVEVVLQAIADFIPSDVCEGQEAVFTNTSTVAAGNLDYAWTFTGADVPTSADHTGKAVWPVDGTTRVINVTLDAIVPGGCSDQITKAITVNAVPDAGFSVVREGRYAYVSANATSGISIYQWTSMNATPAGSETAATEAYEFTNIDEGTFDIELAVKNDNCWSNGMNQVTIDLASVEDLTENNDMIKVYPNPSNGVFNLTVDNASDDVVVMVTDILGNSLPLELKDNLNGNYVISLSGIANGVYFVQVKNGDFYATQKITVSK